MTLFSFGQVVVYGGLNHAITRIYAMAPRYGGLVAYRTSARRRFLHVSGLWSIVLGTLAGLIWVIGRPDWALLLAVVLPYSLLNGALSTLIAFGNATRARRLVALHQAADAVLKVALVLLVAYLASPSVPVLFAAYASASLLVLLSLFVWQGVWRMQLASENHAPMDQVFSRFAGPIYIWAPFTWVLLVADRWALQGFAGAHALALYTVAAQMSLGPVRIGMSALLRFLSPRLFDRLENDKLAALSGLWSATRWAMGLTGLAFAITTLFHMQIVAVLVAPEYQAASALLPWLVLTAGFTATADLVVLRLFGTMNSAALLRPRITTALLGVTLICLGALQFGIWGVVAAQVAQSGLFLLWSMIRAGVPRLRAA
ncbi:hypothetical protein [Ruegeria sp.]|uniref:lipopolysaccharide biosynthesis protein n=1 Tax=Ruegeria sp. TaxID=1879320 RepID=UPI002309ECFF|nr:hypothetical protein [Ruegeria sp.]MDA7963547.1 hypothetical protein [Ruegeria sp.]